MISFIPLDRIDINPVWLHLQLAEIRTWLNRHDTINRSINERLLAEAVKLCQEGRMEQSFQLLVYVRLNLEPASSTYLKGALAATFDEIQRLAIEQHKLSNS